MKYTFVYILVERNVNFVLRGFQINKFNLYLIHLLAGFCLVWYSSVSMLIKRIDFPSC